MRRRALQQVAHVLSEQLARRATLGIDNGVIPLSQIEVADAVGLSVVHSNRIFQYLRELGVLSKKRQVVEVVNKKRPQELAVFDGRYLNAGEPLSRGDVRWLMSKISCPSVAGAFWITSDAVALLNQFLV